MAKKEKENKDKALETALKNLKGFSMKASDKESCEFISTGHLDLDLAITHGITTLDPRYDPEIHTGGGVPMGRITELSGGEGAGKSSEAYRIVANAQKKGYRCMWVDVEHSYSEDLARIYGVDIEKLELADQIDRDDPDHLYSAEEIFDRINDACKTGVRVIVLDSIATLSTEAELANHLAEGGVGLGAVPALLSKALKKLLNYADKYKVLIVLVNQLREKIGIMFGNPEYTPGGRALKHACSVQIRMRKQHGEKAPIHMETEHGPQLIGNYSYIYIYKNRHAAPVNTEIRIPIYYQPYFPGADDIIFNEGRRLKVIAKHLTSFRWDDIKGEGKLGFFEAVRSNGKMQALIDEMKATAIDESIFLPPEVLNYKDDVKLADAPVEEPKDETKVSRRGKNKNSGSSTAEPLVV